MKLETYKKKRDFKRTPEPRPRESKKNGLLTFVIQKHRARQLHYDFRLELDGVMKSWSVPKGPSLNPADKRLAVMVEDHPVDYATFEGVIPEGEYGAGEVIVWDTGTYFPDEKGTLTAEDRKTAEKLMRAGLESGKLSFTLQGKKLKGSWTLVKMQNGKSNWLLMKHRDSSANETDILKEERSVATNRTIEEVRTNPSKVPVVSDINEPAGIPGAHKTNFPSRIAPMLASLGKQPFSGPDWIFEPKLDGYRIISAINEGKTTLYSRNGVNVTGQYPSLLPELNRQAAKKAILDGEIIALDDKGKQCFHCLQNYLRATGKSTIENSGRYPLIYYVFDLLYLDGFDLRDVPLISRKKILKQILQPGEQVKLVDYYENYGVEVFHAAVKNGLEGVIAKRIDSRYQSGKRSDDWQKIKETTSDDFVIGGFSVKKNGRTGSLSSLLLGYYNQKGNLIYAGNVGTGFDEDTLAEIRQRLDSIRTKDIPFAQVPALNSIITWVKPNLVAEVKFRERTQDGRLRHPVFVRLRDDKVPAEVKETKNEISSADADPPPGDDLEQLVEQLRTSQSDTTINTGDAEIKFSNLDKVLWPALRGRHPAYTKRDFLTYLVTASPYMLPHMLNRPLTLTRYPDGIKGEHFYQRHWGHPTPDFIDKVNIRDEKGIYGEYLMCNNLATLLWLGQVANLEFHTWFSRLDSEPDLKPRTSKDFLLNHPDFIIFDLDPYIYSGRESRGDEPELNRKGFLKAGEVAVWLKEILDELKLKAFIKTSGKTGLHIYVPIVRRFDYKSVRAAAEFIGKYLVEKHPAEITTEWSQKKRAGKIFVDYAQNVRGKTLASIYSPRPSPEAAISTPLSWEELGKVYPSDFTFDTLPERLKRTGDLWAGILSAKQDLTDLPTK